MYTDHSLSGRRDKRRPIMMVVRLARLGSEGAEKQERTYTDNISARGIRVVSKRTWHPGQQAEITPVHEESPMRGRVVYCQKLDETRFGVGLSSARPFRPLAGWQTSFLGLFSNGSTVSTKITHRQCGSLLLSAFRKALVKDSRVKGLCNSTELSAVSFSACNACSL